MEIALIIQTIALIIVGVILRNQIKSQNELISNARAIFDLYDIKKLKEYVSVLEETANNKALNFANDFYEEEFKKGRFNDEMKEKMMQETYEELLAFAIKITYNLSKEQREKSIPVLFPKLGTYLTRVIERYKNHS